MEWAIMEFQRSTLETLCVIMCVHGARETLMTEPQLPKL